MNIFKEAAIGKIRFQTVKGTIGLEDLYDIPLTSRDKFNLNDIAKSIYAEIKESGDVNFIGESTPIDETNELKLALVKEVIKHKQEEARSKTELAANKSHNELIDRLIKEKEFENLKNMSVDELKSLRK